MKIEDFDFDNILIDKKSCENILIHKISNKTLIGVKPLHIGLDKANGFIRVYDGTRYLVSFGLKNYDTIYNRIRYLISQRGDITYFFLIIM